MHERDLDLAADKMEHSGADNGTDDQSRDESHATEAGKEMNHRYSGSGENGYDTVTSKLDGSSVSQ